MVVCQPESLRNDARSEEKVTNHRPAVEPPHHAPLLVLSSLAGSVANRYPRKQQVVVAQVLAGAMYAALALLILTGHIQPWHVYATAVGMAMIQAFHQPARAAMIADAVPLCHLTNALGLNSIVFNMARSTGPALAGFLIATHSTAS